MMLCYKATQITTTLLVRGETCRSLNVAAFEKIRRSETAHNPIYFVGKSNKIGLQHSKEVISGIVYMLVRKVGDI